MAKDICDSYKTPKDNQLQSFIWCRCSIKLMLLKF